MLKPNAMPETVAKKDLNAATQTPLPTAHRVKDSLSKNMQAFLDMIAASEGTSTSPATGNDGYDVIVTGVDGLPEVLTDYSDHPFVKRAPKVINHKGLKSSASGRYQIMRGDWPYYKARLKLPDFSPDSQDLYALNQIKECKAVKDIEEGRIEDAIRRCKSRWASLTGAGYGQRERSLAFLLAAYKSAGGATAIV